MTSPRQRTVARFASALSFAVAAAAITAFAGTAFAAGGASIATAPIVVPGQPQLGNTSASQIGYGGCLPPWGANNPAEFWRLSLTAGDKATIDWEVTAPPPGPTVSGQVATLQVWPQGTTDFSLGNVQSLDAFQVDANDKAESVVGASKTGIYPFDIASCADDGFPYDFSVTVKHAVVVFVPSPASIWWRGSIVLRVSDPDGKPISDPALQVTLFGGPAGTHPVALAHGAPKNGKVKLKLHLGAAVVGKPFSIRAVAQGGNYLPASGVTRHTKVVN